jgi:glycosyltransferase involved in cell wall biosynthesis
MRIGVSAWRLAGQRLGIGRYIEYLLRAWNTLLDPEDRVVVFVREKVDLERLGLSSAFSTRLLRPALTNAIWENLLLPRHAKEVDVLFGPSHTIPLTHTGPSVVAIHNVDAAAGALSLWHRYTYDRKYRLSAQRADRVIANSEDVRQRIHTHYGIPLDKIDTIWLGADDAFQPVDDPAILQATRVQYLGSDRPYILFMGGLSQRRNVPALMEAFSVLKKEDGIPHALLLCGPNRANLPLEELATRLGIADSVVHTVGLVTRHSELIPVYAAADLFVLPSVSEGFSLTLAEAMACGVPVITVNRSALGEVANSFALTLEEPTVDALVQSMRRVLGNPEVHAELRRKGLQRARQLRWAETGRRTLEVLRQVAR